MLIIEGADLVGKTTFAKKLVAAMPGRRHLYRHLSRLPEGFAHPWDYLALAHRHSVQDRFHMSEPVYSAVRDEPESPLTPEAYRLVDAHLRTLGAYTVIITATEELIRSRFDARREMYDLDGCVRANELFLGIATDLAEYSPDWDLRITCDADRPFPREWDLDRIITGYQRRQAALSAMLHRRADDHG